MLDGLPDAAWRAEKEKVASAEPAGGAGPQRTQLREGLLTNLANPKAIIYFGSVFSLFVGDSVGAGARWGIFLLIIVETLASVYGGCQPVRPAGDAPRLSADGEVDRRYRRYAVCGLRHPPDYLALTGMLFPTRLFPGGKVSVAKPLQLVFRQTGHFHNRLVINTATAHPSATCTRAPVFTFFMPCFVRLSPYLLQAMFPPASSVILHAAARCYSPYKSVRVSSASPA